MAHGFKLKSIVEFQNVRERAYDRIPVGSLRELALLKERVNKYKRNADLAQDGDMIGMYLTDNSKRDISDHMQIELFLKHVRNKWLRYVDQFVIFPIQFIHSRVLLDLC